MASEDARDRGGTDEGPDAQRIQRVVRATRVFEAMIASSLATTEPSITMAQWRVLELAATAPQNVTSIAGDLGVLPSSVTRLCDRLVRSGLLDRRPFERDRRQVVLTLTTSGRRLVDLVFSDRRRNVEQIMAALTEDERSAVARGIDAFVEAAEHVDLAREQD